MDDARNHDPDVVFPVSVSASGKYVLSAHVDRTEKPVGEVKTLYIKMQVDDQRLTKRIVSDARNYTDHILGVFQLTGQTKTIKNMVA